MIWLFRLLVHIQPLGRFYLQLLHSYKKKSVSFWSECNSPPTYKIHYTKRNQFHSDLNATLHPHTKYTIQKEISFILIWMQLSTHIQNTLYKKKSVSFWSECNSPPTYKIHYTKRNQFHSDLNATLHPHTKYTIQKEISFILIWMQLSTHIQNTLYKKKSVSFWSECNSPPTYKIHYTKRNQFHSDLNATLHPHTKYTIQKEISFILIWMQLSTHIQNTLYKKKSVSFWSECNSPPTYKIHYTKRNQFHSDLNATLHPHTKYTIQKEISFILIWMQLSTHIQNTLYKKKSVSFWSECNSPPTYKIHYTKRNQFHSDLNATLHPHTKYTIQKEISFILIWMQLSTHIQNTLYKKKSVSFWSECNSPPTYKIHYTKRNQFHSDLNATLHPHTKYTIQKEISFILIWMQLSTHIQNTLYKKKSVSFWSECNSPPTYKIHYTKRNQFHSDLNATLHPHTKYTILIYKVNATLHPHTSDFFPSIRMRRRCRIFFFTDCFKIILNDSSHYIKVYGNFKVCGNFPKWSLEIFCYPGLKIFLFDSFCPSKFLKIKTYCSFTFISKYVVYILRKFSSEMVHTKLTKG